MLHFYENEGGLSTFCLVGRMVASATADDDDGSGKLLLGFFRFFENFSVVARSLALPSMCDCLVGRVVASATVDQEVSGLISGSSKE
ncbi:hypothetical protein SFRURICE_014447 [Spodoptera frugiperda]|nr:hypothetical protein SFRURICE_014447 [Spodoptera frugiperda]